MKPVFRDLAHGYFNRLKIYFKIYGCHGIYYYDWSIELDYEFQQQMLNRYLPFALELINHRTIGTWQKRIIRFTFHMKFNTKKKWCEFNRCALRQCFISSSENVHLNNIRFEIECLKLNNSLWLAWMLLKWSQQSTFTHPNSLTTEFLSGTIWNENAGSEWHCISLKSFALIYVVIVSIRCWLATASLRLHRHHAHHKVDFCLRFYDFWRHIPTEIVRRYCETVCMSVMNAPATGNWEIIKLWKSWLETTTNHPTKLIESKLRKAISRIYPLT